MGGIIQNRTIEELSVIFLSILVLQYIFLFLTEKKSPQNQVANKQYVGLSWE